MQFKKLNWFSTPTAWEQAQVWREKRAAMRQQFEAAQSAAINGFGTAWSNEITGLGDLVVQQVQARLQADAKAKAAAAQAKLAATQSSLDALA
jgi:hypothetical protein